MLSLKYERLGSVVLCRGNYVANQNAMSADFAHIGEFAIEGGERVFGARRTGRKHGPLVGGEPLGHRHAADAGEQVG